MSRNNRSGAVIWLLLFSSLITMAQSPEWSVDYSQFQFRMTASVVLERQGELLSQGENKVAVFVGDELRGVGFADAYHEPTGRYLAIFQIGSNQIEGEELQFKVYDETADEVISARFLAIFQADELIGTITDPMVLSDNQFPTGINLSDVSFEENTELGTSIATISTDDGDDISHVYTLSSFDPEFSADFIAIQDNQIIVTDTLSFEELPAFSLLITSTDPFGASVIEEVAFTVLDQAEAPFSMQLSNLRIAENNALSEQIALINVEDEDHDETFEYSFTQVLENGDSAYFKIDENRLLSNTVFNYESRSSLEIFLTCTDKDGLSFTQSFTIAVDDLEEPEPVSNYLSPNRDGFNDFLVVENAEIYPGFTLKVFTPQGNEVYRKTGYDNSWDGYYQGKPLPSGVYHYVFENASGEVSFNGLLYIKDR